jgi:UDP-3-O-[3-hydroxymyristoyl] N-acetylglucosamine deacetylase
VQSTVKSSVRFDGVGLHSGAAVRMVVKPAGANSGICFERIDLPKGENVIPARWDLAVHVPLCTRLRNAFGAEISTIEHIMAALSGCGIQNAWIEIDGPEVPIMDGSSAGFVEALIDAGLHHEPATLRAIKVLRPVGVSEGEAYARLSPADNLEIDFSIEFADAAIGAQDKLLNMANGAFVRELSSSRTFCRKADVDNMHARGLALGGTMENAVVVDGQDVLSPGGLRFADEPVRHKMLDALGDLALAGAPLLARYTGNRAGHSLTNKLLRALFAQPDSFVWVNVDAATARRLPGVGVKAGDVPQHT